MGTKRIAIYVLDDYAVHLMPEIRQAFKKGYILVIIGGKITGDIQINDIQYQDLEIKLMLEQLEKNPTEIPSPLQNEIMSMLLALWEKLQINTEKEFRSLFVTNALNGSEDYLVSDKLYVLIREEILKFRICLMLSRPKQTPKEVVRKLIPPKGISRKRNFEGSELLDFENEEIPIEEFQEECNNEEETNEDAESEERNENRESVVVPTANDNLTSHVHTIFHFSPMILI